eukprot:3743862-Prymnesium_polylepis.1
MVTCGGDMTYEVEVWDGAHGGLVRHQKQPSRGGCDTRAAGQPGVRRRGQCGSEYSNTQCR